jgi:hypothetical protein
MLTGHCLCNAVRYSIASPPLSAFICTCRACVRLSAGARFAGFSVPAAAVTIEGPIKIFVHAGGSGAPARRHFCAECCSYIFSSPDVMEGTVNFSIGSLDDPDAVTPQVAVFTRSRAAWDVTPDGVQCFQTLPQGAPPVE